MPIEKLTKILHLEAEKYEDKAVMGGLSRYADAWVAEAGTSLGPGAAAWAQSVADQLRAYADLRDVPQRQRAVAALQQMLQTGPPDSAPQQQTAVAPAPVAQQTPSVARRRRAPAPSAREQTGIDSAATALQGIGPKQAQRLARLGIHTIRDMLYCLPRRHEDYSQLKTINRLEYGESVTIIAQVRTTSQHQSRKGMQLFKATVSDGSGSIDVTWFNQPYLADRIKRGQQIVLSGEVDEYLGRLCFNSPEWELLDDQLLHTARLVPIYPLTKGIQPKWLRRLMKRTVEYWSKRLPDHLPLALRQDAHLLDVETALSQAHFPDNLEMLKRANHRLAFDELFLLQIGLLRQRHLWRKASGRALPVEPATLSQFVDSLPFGLTEAQQRVLAEVISDIQSDHPMNRLLQGDVGSGKTVVAAAAMAMTVAAGAQAAMMAPTEILAEQHHRTICDLLAHAPGATPEIRLLTGSTTGQEREAVYQGLADGSVDIVVGTHALIQEGVAFHGLAFVVIDEQHRFGVRQRAGLRQKGYNPHVLVMTATPIPRSLELTLWGHLDVSVIDELPPGRQPVTTRVIPPTARERAYAFVRRQVEQGRQAFIICPLVEESDKIEAKAAVDEYARLQEQVFPDLQLGLLHGRMNGREKEATMNRFARGELDVLISTAVVEVGVDVPNATVMLVEGANRFGLAQLHQFRGRVGRGEHASYCLLVSDAASTVSAQRLEAVEATTDGFELAQMDLDLRGPGEFLGTRQSGLPDLSLASVSDLRLVEEAREAARRLFKVDPELAEPDNQLLVQRVAQFWQGKGEVS